MPERVWSLADRLRMDPPSDPDEVRIIAIGLAEALAQAKDHLAPPRGEMDVVDARRVISEALGENPDA